MRAYSVGEDNIILEAALISGVHKSHGRYGGFHRVLRKFFKTHQTLCKSRGLATERSLTSLKMRMYRLYSSGIMRWGMYSEKKKVSQKQRCTLKNIGTSEQRKTRDYLIDVMFSDRGVTMKGISMVETEKKGDVSRQAREAVAAARAARRARRAIEKGNESSTEPCSAIARVAVMDNESSTAPCSAIAHPYKSNTFHPDGQLIQIDQARSVVPVHPVEEEKGNISTHQIYKMNLKAIRELAAMRHDALQFIQREYESHTNFLKKTLAQLAEQQKCILRKMETEAESK